VFAAGDDDGDSPADNRQQKDRKRKRAAAAAAAAAVLSQLPQDLPAAKGKRQKRMLAAMAETRDFKRMKQVCCMCADSVRLANTGRAC
jgi:hypothetical protein